MSSKPINFLVVGQYFWPENFRINQITSYLNSEKKINVSVLTGKPNYPEGDFFKGYGFWGQAKDNYYGAPIFRVPVIPRGKNSGFRLLLNYISFVIFSCTIGVFLTRKINAKVVFVYATSPIFQAIPAILISKIHRARLIIYVQDLWPESVRDTGYINNKLILSFIDFFVKVIYQNADLIIVQSKGFLPGIKKKCQNADIRYLPNSIMEGGLSKNSYESKILKEIDDALRTDFFNVVIAGNIGKAQSPDTILKSAEILKIYGNIKIILVGEGSALEYIKTQTVLRGIKNIKFVGRLHESYMQYVYSRTSVLLLTLERSSIFSLTIPNRLQSYLAAGKPIIGAVEGESEKIIVDSGSGVIVPPGDEKELSKAIYQFSVENGGKLEQMGKNGKEYFNLHFNHSELMETLKKWICEIGS